MSDSNESGCGCVGILIGLIILVVLLGILRRVWFWAFAAVEATT